MKTEDSQTAGELRFTLGPFTVSPATGHISGPDGDQRVEPKVMELLVLLSMAGGTVVSRADIEAKLWDRTFIAEDAVARLVSKLRKALDDQAGNPRFVETLPKRGYRLVQPAVAIDMEPRKPHRFAKPALLAAGLVFVLLTSAVALLRGEPEPSAQNVLASFYYTRLTLEDAQRSADLFGQTVEASPTDFTARVGLANALVQTVLLTDTGEDSGLTASLQAERHLDPVNLQILQQALFHADAALLLRPGDAEALKARGLALSAASRLDEAIAAYEAAIEDDAENWQALLNLAEIWAIREDFAAKNVLFERAYAVMHEVHADDLEVLTRWGAPVAAEIGYYYLGAGDADQARAWFEAALSYRPRFEVAMTGLAIASDAAEATDVQ